MSTYREALARLHRVASGQSSEAYMSIPARPDVDADLLLIAALDELEQLRGEVVELRGRLEMAEEHFPCDDGLVIDALLKVPGLLDGKRWDCAGDMPAAVAHQIARAERAEHALSEALRRAEESEAREASLEAEARRLREALEAINGCIAWSDTMQAWVLAGRIRTQPALEKVRTALAALEGRHG
jgi:hypothetical protein